MNGFKFKIFLTGLALSDFICLNSAFAQESPIKSTSDVLRVLGNIANFLFTATLIVAVIFIIIAAFNFLTAQGDAEKVKSARNQIFYAAIAIAIVLISAGAASIIKSFLP